MNPSETVNACQARAHFSRLLDRVERGESIAISRGGVAVARLVPVPEVVDRDKVRRAVEALKVFGEGIHLPKGATIQDLIREDRR